MSTIAPDILTVLFDDTFRVSSESRHGTHKRVVRFLQQHDMEEAIAARKLLVFTSATRLVEFAKVISLSSKQNRLQVLLVQSDIDPAWVPFMLKRAGLRTLRNLLVHQDEDVPNRVLNAWMNEQQHDTIAAATVFNDRLLVVSCDFDSHEIPFDAYPALRRIPASERQEFAIQEDGVFLHWPAADVHLDLCDIRLALDPGLQKKARAQKIAHDRAFGSAVRRLREKHGIPQRGIAGLSARHVRRIENGYIPGVDAIDALAHAHGMNPDTYLEEVTEIME